VEEVKARGPGAEIRRAGPRDAESLSRIAFAAKGHWGYPERWMERWREGLTITQEFFRESEVYAAVVEGEPAGFYALVGEGPKIELEHLWVLPERMGTGLGRALFDHAVGRAAALGAEVLGIEADPNAEGFYRHMGATRIGEIVYELDGRKRVLPLLAVQTRGHRPAQPPKAERSNFGFASPEPRGAGGGHGNQDDGR
jgi:GNAT superfamily N-acetyltransferase